VSQRGLVEELERANVAYARTHCEIPTARPARRLTVVTCMDARIDVLGVLGLDLGDAQVLRNAGARVTDDTIRSLTLSTHMLGVDTVVVLQHSKCALLGATDAELRQATGVPLDFLPIADHRTSLTADIERLASEPSLQSVALFAGMVFDVETGRIDELVRSERAAANP